MKRDMDFIREILFAIEEQNEDRIRGKRSDGETDGHFRILCQAGYIERITNSTKPVTNASLTWEGHNFLDSIRDKSVWKEAQERATKVGGRMSIDLWSALVKEIAKGMIGL